MVQESVFSISAIRAKKVVVSGCGVFMPFEKFGFSVMDQAFCAYSGLVGLEDGMPVVKGEFGTGVYCGPKSHFNLFGRQFRAVPLPLALLLLVFFLLSLKGIAGEVSADQITGSKAEQQAGCDRLDSREASIEPALKGDGGDDAENGRKKMGKVFHDWMPTLQMACMLVLCFAVGGMNIMLDNKSQIIKNQEKVLIFPQQTLSLHKQLKEKT